ncbi:MAG: AEC family transporter [Lachnospiraceae bacterium]|nr:AEC family transporter [Lachnospiraceae bacterium]
MLESLKIVGTQVFILFILIMLGFFGGKKKLMTKEGVRCINDIMLYFVTPCVIINAFQREYDSTMLHNLLLSILAALISHVICYIAGFLFIHDKEEAAKRTKRFAIAYSNCGFMALPLLDALLGSEGVFYGAGYLCVFNILVWSYGQYTIGKGKEGFEIKKAFLNPGVIASVIGFIFFITSFELPLLIIEPIKYLAALNTPVPMLIIGYTISSFALKEQLRIKGEIVSISLRLIVCPMALLGILYLMGIRGTLLVASIVSASAPVAAISTMFSIKYDGDVRLASKMVAVSSLFSIITMTLIVGFTRYIA